MTDALHDKLADALQTALLRGDFDHSDRLEIHEALAAYEAAKREPVKLLKLKRYYIEPEYGVDTGNCFKRDRNGDVMDSDEAIEAIRDQLGIEVEAIP